ncbi:MAG: hypothetical protein QOF14_4672 [Hyphomicrobiales bacterium]|jgi:hypothetical protein|nr:hypothetical protein [Hyphomicrobiales bacterium]
MRLVFVHGMRQEGRVLAELRKEWESAMTTAWAAGGLATCPYTLEMPFYGNVLNDLTMQVRGGSGGVIARGDGAPGTFTPLEEELLREMASNAGVSNEEVRAELGQEVVARGPANWEWVQALGRVLERKVPTLGQRGLGFVHQVDAYLTRPHIRAAVDDIVRPFLLNGPTVVVAHSLGSVVAFRLLREVASRAVVPLFITLGSPLAINVVKKYLRPPALQIPEGVSKWLNGSDERDYVALYARLDRDSFAEGIENISDIHNRRDDAHAIVDYLGDKTVAKQLHAALGASG